MLTTLLILAWIAALLGFAFAYLLALANGMKTAPTGLSLPQFFIAAIVPLAAITLSALAIKRAISYHYSGWTIVAAVPPILIAILAIAVAVPWPGMFSGKHSFLKRDTIKRADGVEIYADTTSNWKADEALYRETVASEADKQSPPGGFDSWAIYWTSYFDDLLRWQENPTKRIDLIRQLRREAGLAELPSSRPEK